MSGLQRVAVVLACVSASMLSSCGAVDEKSSGGTPGNGDATKEAGAVAPFRKNILVDGWEPVGLSGGGGMFTPAYSPIVPGLVMLSCDMGAEYLSRDGGRTWRMIPFRKLRANIRCTPAFHPTDPDVIVFGASDGTIMVSRDRGENWQPLGKIAGRCRGAVVFDYDNPELLLVGDVDVTDAKATETMIKADDKGVASVPIVQYRMSHAGKETLTPHTVKAAGKTARVTMDARKGIEFR